jgi:hypothetical protein
LVFPDRNCFVRAISTSLKITCEDKYDAAATSDGSYNHLWESFAPQKYDSYFDIEADGSTTEKVNRIYCSMETAMLGDEMDLKQFMYSEIEATQIGGVVDVTVSFRGSKGKHRQVLKQRILAVTDQVQWGRTPYAEKIENFGYLSSQYRRLITESSQRILTYQTCESQYPVDIDKAFSILIEWCGQLGVEIVRIYIDPFPTKSLGSPQRDETKYCVVGQDGENFTIDNLPNAYDPNNGQQTSWYAQVFKTVTLNCPAGSPSPAIAATAEASFLSRISYEHAQEEASTLALQAANAAAQQYRAENPCLPPP